MNAVTKKIAEVLGVEPEVAVEVQDYIETWYDFDFSEISATRFKKEIVSAYADFQAGLYMEAI